MSESDWIRGHWERNEGYGFSGWQQIQIKNSMKDGKFRKIWGDPENQLRRLPEADNLEIGTERQGSLPYFLFHISFQA